MGLETGDYVADLVITNPLSTDPKSAGDDHLRLLKKVLKETLNGFAGAILVTATETGTASAHVLTPTTALVGYATGTMLLYRPSNAGTGALTVNVSALGAKSVKTIMGADPTSGDITANQPILLMYDGTNFVLLCGSAFLGKTGNQTLTGNLTLTGNETVSGTLGVTGALSGTTGAFSGDVTGQTATAGDNSTKFATTAFAVGLAFSAALPAQPGTAVANFLSSLSGVAAWGPVINENRGADIASAATINLTTATGNFVHITGTTTITAITLSSGSARDVVFDGALTLTHNATTLILPGAANITTAAGDRATFRGDGSGNTRCIHYTKSSGLAVIAASASTQAKAWAKFDSSATISASYNVSSITDDGTGVATVNFTQAFSSANYSVVAMLYGTTGSDGGFVYASSSTGQAAGSVQLVSKKTLSLAAYDPVSYYVVCFGDQ